MKDFKLIKTTVVKKKKKKTLSFNAAIIIIARVIRLSDYLSLILSKNSLVKHTTLSYRCLSRCKVTLVERSCTLTMGKLLSLLARDESTCCTPQKYDVFLDFESKSYLFFSRRFLFNINFFFLHLTPYALIFFSKRKGERFYV